MSFSPTVRTSPHERFARIRRHPCIVSILVDGLPATVEMKGQAESVDTVIFHTWSEGVGGGRRQVRRIQTALLIFSVRVLAESQNFARAFGDHGQRNL